MKKHLPFAHLLLSACLFFAAMGTTWATAHHGVKHAPQEVYFSTMPLPKLVAPLVRQGWSQDAIIAHLKKTLPRLTPQFARKQFGITWIDNTVRSDYPPVAVCFMGKTLGYGLFALVDIPEKTSVVEYTGRVVLDPNALGVSPYARLISKKGATNYKRIDAMDTGNASRFAKHLPDEKTLKLYQYEIEDGSPMSANDIAMANSFLGSMAINGDEHMFLITTRAVRAFEQIGYFYSKTYGYACSLWPQKAILFDQQGSVVPEYKYRIRNTVIGFVDQMLGGEFVYYVPYVKEQYSRIDHYMFKETSQGRIIADEEKLQEVVATFGSRPCVNAYWVPNSTNLMMFVHTLKLLDKHTFRLNKEECVNILTAAKENQYDAVTQLLSERGIDGAIPVAESNHITVDHNQGNAE